MTEKFEICLIEIPDGFGMAKNDAIRLIDRMTDGELLPMKCHARKKDTVAIGFIKIEFAKLLNYDYAALENFVASILDSSVPSDECAYRFRDRKIWIERI